MDDSLPRAVYTPPRKRVPSFSRPAPHPAVAGGASVENDHNPASPREPLMEQSPQGKVETPALVIPTVAGLPPHLTPDVWGSFLNRFVGETKTGLCLGVPVDSFDVETREAIGSLDGGLVKFIGQRPRNVFLISTWRDSDFSSKAGGPNAPLSFTSQLEKAIKLGAASKSVEVKVSEAPAAKASESKMGLQKAAVDVAVKGYYQTLVRQLRPDALFLPGDPVPESAGKNRVAAAMEASATWTDAALSGLEESAASVLGFVHIVGSDSASVDRSIVRALELIKSQKQRVSSPNVLGFVLDLGTRAATLSALQRLKGEQLPITVVGGASGPEEILQYIDAGASFVESSYPQLLTSLGMVSVYAVEPSESLLSAAQRGEAGPMTYDGADKAFKLDTRPLVEGCACFSCANHTRGYLCHLLDSHEMFSSTMLYAHNLHRLLELVEAARGALQKGEFDAWFARWRACHGLA